MGKILSVLLYPLSPICAFLVSIRHFKERWGYLMFILVSLHLNLCITFLKRDDITRYVEAYNDLLRGVDWVNRVDLYYPLTAHIFSLLHAAPIIIYVFWSIIYYTGVYLCIKVLLEYTSNNIISILFFIISLFFITPFCFSILRYFTAAYWFIYFIYMAETTNKQKYLFLLCICPLVHYTFTIQLFIYFIYRLYKPRLESIFYIFIITYILSFIPSFYTIELSYLKDILHGNNYYLSESRNVAMYSSYNWGKFLYLPIQLCVVYYFFLQYINRTKLNEHNIKLLRMALIIFIMLNFLSVSFDAVTRFRGVALWLSIFPILYFYNQYKHSDYNYFILAFGLCFFFNNYDFFFVSGPEFFNYRQFFFTDIFTSIINCSSKLNNI